jgi:hypothetical protein
MVVKSLISGETYIWLRVPRTASKTYGKIFFPDGNYEHKHNNYYHETYTHGEIPAFSVVRNPHTRFVSSIKYIAKQQKLNGNLDRFQFTLPYYSIETICDFLNENLKKLQNVFSDVTYKEVFKTNDITFIRLFFIPQHHYVGFPPVKIFKYEQLDEFNTWIENKLGYSTQSIEKYNSSSDELEHINFEHDEFVKITKRLFEEDYKFFGYV